MWRVACVFEKSSKKVVSHFSPGIRQVSMSFSTLNTTIKLCKLQCFTSVVSGGRVFVTHIFEGDSKFIQCVSVSCIENLQGCGTANLFFTI